MTLQILERDMSLLHLAAKAAGYGVICEQHGKLHVFVLGTHENFHWNPLEDDGDALRLADNLNIDIEWYPEYSWAGNLDAGTYWTSVLIREHSNDKLKAMRYAIVSCAAKIGKDMK